MTKTKPFSHIVAFVLALVMVVSCFSVSAFAAPHPEEGMLPTIEVTPVGAKAFYKIDNGVVVYADTDDGTGWTAVPSAYITGSSYNEGNVAYGAYVVNADEVVFVPLSECHVTDSGEYEYFHGTKDSATVSEDVDTATNDDPTMGTDFYLRVENGIDPDGPSKEDQIFGSTDDERVSYVTIDFVGTVDGKEFTGGSAENVDLQIGYGQYLEEFENSIIGHKAGEEFTVDVEFPTDYGITTDTEGNELDLGEKTATFSITVKSINEFALSDENVADYFSLYNEDKADEEKILTIEKMKAAFMEEYSNSLLQNRVLENLMENTEIVEIPQSVIDAFVHVEMELVEYNAASAGLSAETLVQANNFESLAAYEEYVTENSVSAIKEQLVLLAVAEKENIQYDEATCRSAFQGEPSELVEMYGQGYVSQNVICYKVIDVLTNAAIIN